MNANSDDPTEEAKISVGDEPTDDLGKPAWAPKTRYEVARKEAFELHGVHYRVKRLLGIGGMGATALVDTVPLGEEMGQELVVKYAFDQKDSIEALDKEWAYLQQISTATNASPYVIPAIDHGRSRLPIKMCGEVMHMDLPVLILSRGYENPYRYFQRRIPADVGVDVMTSLLYAGHMLAKDEVVHGDIAPKNLLIAPNRTVKKAQAKLVKSGGYDAHIQHEVDRALAAMIAWREFSWLFIDFGCADNRSTRKLESYMGTPRYLSPEGMTQGDMGPKRDTWAIMATCAEMIFGVAPWEYTKGHARDIAEAMKQGLPPYMDLEGLIDGLTMPPTKKPHTLDRFKKNLLRIFESGLEPNAKKRMTGYELYQDCGLSFEMKEDYFTDHTQRKRKRWKNDIFEFLDPLDLLCKLRSAPTGRYRLPSPEEL
jgi:serine/threonine protein kinase